MTIRRLVYHGDPVLHAPCQAASTFDPSFRQLIDDLTDTLYSTTGVGLAAPQIGVNKRVFIIDPFRVAGKRNGQILVNPTITFRAGKVVSERESCLSAPALHLDVPRSEIVRVEGLDGRGKPISFEVSGFAAIVIQHEMDHLDGHLVSDLLDGERRPEYERLLARVVQQHTSHSYIKHLHAIRQRLNAVAQRADGILHAQRTGGYDMVVEKTGNLLELSVRARAGSSVKRIIGLLDLLAPIDLLQTEAKAMMLSLLWVPEPERICVVGLGGGRLPMVFHQHFPAAAIDAVEPDPYMIVLTRRFFGMQPDNHFKVVASTGRDYLERNVDVKYDVILVESDGAGGHGNYSMSTREFYDVCKLHLSSRGVVVSAFSRDENLKREKIMTFAASFSQVYQFDSQESQIMFGSNVVAVNYQGAFERVEEHYIPRNFSVREIAANLHPLSLQGFNADFSAVLIDADIRRLVRNSARVDSSFSGAARNDPCPCGSGKKFKKCHGRPPEM